MVRVIHFLMLSSPALSSVHTKAVGESDDLVRQKLHYSVTSTFKNPHL